MKTGSHTINSNRNDRCDVLLKQVLKLAKFRHPQCAKITSREMFETANREKNPVYTVVKKAQNVIFQSLLARSNRRTLTLFSPLQI